MASLADELEKLNISGNSSDSDSSDSDSDYGESMDRLFNPNRTIFTFGRFQPPTIGHEGLIRSVEEYAIDLQAQPYVFVSLTQNALKDSEWKKAIPKLRNRNEYITNKINENPLSPDIKIEILKKMFPKTKINFINGSLLTPRVYSIQGAIKYLTDKKEQGGLGYNEIYFLVGSKRFQQFKQLEFEKKFDIRLIENKRVLDNEQMPDELLYELGNLTEQDIQEINQIKPSLVSGTRVRQIAAEHKVNMKDVNNLNDRQVRMRIDGKLVEGIRGHTITQDKAFNEFKERMSRNLSDNDLEYYIYLIKKGMGLNPFKSYVNKNPDLARKSTRTKRGGKRKQTRKKKKRKRKRTKKKHKKKHRKRRKTKKKY